MRYFRTLRPAGEEFVQTQNGYSAYPSAQWTVTYTAGSGRIGAAACDWKNSLDNLQAQAPNTKFVNLYVTWYGKDLRAGSCTLVPGVTHTGLGELPHEWGCAGYTRATAHLVSTVDGNSAFGGTPDDASVVAAIRGYAHPWVKCSLYSLHTYGHSFG